jgi:hypothetical protein
VVGLVSAMCASLCLIECSHANGADVARSVVAGSYRGVLNGRGANEADFGVGVFVVVLWEDDLWDGRRCLPLLVGLSYGRFAFFRSMSSTTACAVSLAPSAPTPRLRIASAPASLPVVLMSVFRASGCASSAAPTSSASPLRTRRDARLFLSSSLSAKIPSRSHRGVSKVVLLVVCTGSRPNNNSSG